MRYLPLLSLLFLAGCQTPPAAPAPVLPAYAELAARHNDRVSKIERFWARTVLELRWVDAEGRSRFEQGEGHLILELPRHSAMTLGKVGQVKLWAGSNDTHFWLFDELADRKLYLGRHDGAPNETPGVKQASPLPVRPVDLPRLLGILPMPASEGAGDVKQVDDMYVVEPAGSATRYYIHPLYGRVVRVDLLDEKRNILLTSKLGDKVEAIADEYDYPSGPFLNTRFEVTAPGREGSMTLYLFGMTDAKRRVNPNAFNLDRLIKTEFKPNAIVPIESK